MNVFNYFESGFWIFNGILEKYEGDESVVIIPEGVTEIGEKAFYELKTITKVVLPKGITRIGKFAFLGCSSLSDVILPEGLLSIESYAFEKCTSLTKLILPDSLTEIGEYVFTDSALTEITIPGGLSQISSYTFRDCRNLTYAVIENGVTQIGQYTFCDCRALKNITIPSSVNRIGGRAFLSCHSLESVTIEDLYSWCNICFDNEDSNPLVYAETLKLNGELVKNLIIPDGVETIHSYAFRCCNMEAVTIPNSVKTIESEAFCRCENLREVRFTEGLEKIFEMAFLWCENLTRITIPESVVTIGKSAFGCCKSLTYAKLPVYYECRKLEIFDQNCALKIEYTGKLPEKEIEKIYHDICKKYMIHCQVIDWANDTGDSGMGYDYDHSYENNVEIEKKDLVFRDGKLIGIHVRYSARSDILPLEGNQSVIIIASNSPRYKDSCSFTLMEKIKSDQDTAK